MSDSYLNYDMLFVYVNLDGSPLDYIHKHGYVIPVDLELAGISCAINQYGIPNTNYVQIDFRKSNPLTASISNTNVAICKVIGVSF